MRRTGVGAGIIPALTFYPV